jgi:hypothetical protein
MLYIQLGNVVEEAQKNSSLYNPKIVLADPLKKPKEKKVDTVGKGWFNFEVILF